MPVASWLQLLPDWKLAAPKLPWPAVPAATQQNYHPLSLYLSFRPAKTPWTHQAGEAGWSEQATTLATTHEAASTAANAQRCCGRARPGPRAMHSQRSAASATPVTESAARRHHLPGRRRRCCCCWADRGRLHTDTNTGASTAPARCRNTATLQHLLRAATPGQRGGRGGVGELDGLVMVLVCWCPPPPPPCCLHQRMPGWSVWPWQGRPTAAAGNGTGRG